MQGLIQSNEKLFVSRQLIYLRVFLRQSCRRSTHFLAVSEVCTSFPFI